MEPAVEKFVEQWRDALKRGDPGGTLALLADEMTFYSPVLFKPSTDRAYIDTVLRFVEETLSDFEYIEIYSQPGGAAMVFRARVGEMTVEGIDLFKINGEGKATELKVMIRPLNAAMALAQIMKDHFSAMGAAG